jgi:hypothetical protein
MSHLESLELRTAPAAILPAAEAEVVFWCDDSPDLVVSYEADATLDGAPGPIDGRLPFTPLPPAPTGPAGPGY